jgi:FKBP-type peptidyl-prolyl cis-trans isomerase
VFTTLQTIKEGEENTRPVKGQTVTVRCVGHLDNGTEIDKYDNLQFVVGDDDFIHGS